MENDIISKEINAKKHTLQTPYPVGPVHFYTIETDEFVLIFDTGPRTKEAEGFLKKLFQDCNKKKFLLLTHCHADHYGMLDLFESMENTEIFISKYDIFKFEKAEERLKILKKILITEKFPIEAVKSIEESLRYFTYSVPFPKCYHILEENNEFLQSLGIRFHRCPGHSQSDILYTYKNFAISGDIILRNIFQTPLLDIDFSDPGARFSNYDAFVDTALKLKDFTGFSFLPGHRDYIDSVDERISFYTEKVRERASFLKDLCGRCSVYEVVKMIVNDVAGNPFASYIKASETFFVRDYLESPEKLDKLTAGLV